MQVDGISLVVGVTLGVLQILGLLITVVVVITSMKSQLGTLTTALQRLTLSVDSLEKRMLVLEVRMNNGGIEGRVGGSEMEV